MLPEISVEISIFRVSSKFRKDFRHSGSWSPLQVNKPIKEKKISYQKLSWTFTVLEIYFDILSMKKFSANQKFQLDFKT